MPGPGVTATVQHKRCNSQASSLRVTVHANTQDTTKVCWSPHQHSNHTERHTRDDAMRSRNKLQHAWLILHTSALLLQRQRQLLLLLLHQRKRTGQPCCASAA
jgi:hypothetical protein